MSAPTRAGYLLAAAALHAAVLGGFTFSPPHVISRQETPGDSIEVGLVDMAGEAAQPAPNEPAPASETPPVPEESPPPTPVPATPSADPTPDPEPPKTVVTTDPALVAPRPPDPGRAKAKATPRSSGGPGRPGSTTGTGGASGEGPGRAGDNAHASFRDRVKPLYPPSAKAARQTGSVQVTVSVGSSGQPLSARVSAGSGFPALDEAAAAAARQSTYNPRRIGGVPLNDTVTVPYTFRIEDR